MNAPKPERRMLGRLILETPAGHREPLADLWSDTPLNAASLLEAVTRHVGGALDPSTTDIRSHDPGNPAPLPAKPQSKPAEPGYMAPGHARPVSDRSHDDSAATRDARRGDMFPPPVPVRRNG